jgi:hypothetical protein
MNLTRVTGSKAALVRACEGFLALAWNDTPNEFAGKGSTTHRMLAAVANDGVLEASDDGDVRALYAAGRAWMDTQLRAMRGQRPLWRGEIAFAFDAETGAARELVDPPGADARWYADPAARRAYDGPGGPVRDAEIGMRLDLVSMGLDEDGPFVWVADYKCHFSPEALEAKDQLALAGLAAARAYGVDRAKVVGVHLWTDRPTFEEPYELFTQDLADVAAFYGELAARAAPGEATPGPWCTERHCPAIAACPRGQEGVREVEALIPAEQLVGPAKRSLAAKPQTPEDAAWVLVAIPLVRALLDAREEEARAVADRHPGQVTAGGKVFGGQDERQERPDLGVPGAVELLEALGLRFAIEESTTWTAMRAVGGAEKADEAREGLRGIGAIRESVRRAYRWRAAGKAAPAPREALAKVIPLSAAERRAS